MDSLNLVGSNGSVPSNSAIRNRQQRETNESASLFDSEALTAHVDESSQEEELSQAEVLQRLQDAWINEKFAPDLLEHQIEVVNCMLDQIADIKNKINIEQSKKTTSKNFGFALYEMEIARVKFLISSYLRIRLEKIQRFVYYLLEQEAKAIEGANSESTDSTAPFSRMTKEELTFANRYKNDLQELFQKLALDHMPGRAKEFDPAPSSSGGSSSNQSKGKGIDPPPPQPNFNSCVFVKAVGDVSGVIISDEAGRGRDEEYDMVAGSQHILSFNSVAHLIRNGSVKLM